MFLFIILLGVLNTSYVILASEKPVSGATIKIQCKDSPQPPLKYPVEFVKYSETAKNILENLSEITDSPIPLEQATSAVFDCLIKNFVEELYNADNKISDARKKFQELKLKCPNIAPSDLLIQSNYLDMNVSIFDTKEKKNINFKSLIASLYTDYLKNNAFQITMESGVTSCDGLPHELEPFIAGWLLHDLFEKMKPEEIKRNFKFSGTVEAGPILSNSGFQDGFACIWAQIGGNIFQSDLFSNRCAFFDFSKKDRFQEKRFSMINLTLTLNEKTQFAISEDEKYLLIVHSISILPAPLQATIFLYDLSQLKKNEEDILLPNQTFSLSHSINEINSILFDSKTNTFNIIAYSQIVPEAIDKKIFYRHTVTPNPVNLQTQQEDISDENKKKLSSSMIWSCIHGNLIGVSSNLVVVHDGKNLSECFFDNKDNRWSYKKGEKEIPLNFCIVQAKEKSALSHGHRDFSFAVPNSFIPNFQELLAKKLKNTIICDELRFDANRYRQYFIVSSSTDKGSGVMPGVGILYPGKEKFVKSCDILNKRVLSGNPRVLVDAFCIDRLERNPESWEVDCKNILEPKMLISEDIQKIYKIDQLLETKKFKSLSWTQALWQGKLLAYAQKKWQSLYSQYKKPLLGILAVGSAGLAMWYLSKYGKKVCNHLLEYKDKPLLHV
jgi:hypothetical protein